MAALSVFWRTSVKLSNLKITPKLGILVGVTLLGLSVAGLLAGYLMQQEMLAECARRANAMTFDNGVGYLFGTDYNGITVLSPDPKQIGTNRMDVLTNGRAISREWMSGVLAKGEHTMFYDYVKPGQSVPIRKVAYAAAIPGWNMYIGAGAYLDDIDAKLKPIAWMLGLAI